MKPWQKLLLTEKEYYIYKQIIFFRQQRILTSQEAWQAVNNIQNIKVSRNQARHDWITLSELYV